MINIQIGSMLSLVLYSLIPILVVQAIFALLYFTLKAPYRPSKPFAFIGVESVAIDGGNSPSVAIVFGAQTEYIATRQNLTFTKDGMFAKTADSSQDVEVPYSEIAGVRYGRMRPIMLLDGAVTFSLAIPIALVINGPLANWAGIPILMVLGIAPVILAAVLFLGSFLNSRYIFFEIISPTRGHLGLTVKESPTFGLPEAKRIAAIVGDMISHADRGS